MIKFKYVLYIILIFLLAPTDAMKSPDGHITAMWFTFDVIRGILLVSMLISANRDGLKGKNIFF